VNPEPPARISVIVIEKPYLPPSRFKRNFSREKGAVKYS